MGRWRKKPVEIEAVRFVGIDGEDEHGPVIQLSEAAPDWLTDAMNAPPYVLGAVWRSSDGLLVHTLEGDMRANPGDWIIRGIEGELYPCKPDIFQRSYERVA